MWGNVVRMRAPRRWLTLVATVGGFACTAVVRFDDVVPPRTDVGAPLDQRDGSADPAPDGEPPDAGLVVDLIAAADGLAADLPLPADRPADLPSPADRPADLPLSADRPADLPLSADRAPDLAPPPPPDDDD
jgi:hypothetical protein